MSRKPRISKNMCELAPNISSRDVDQIDLVRFYGRSFIDPGYLKADVRKLQTPPQLLNPEHANGPADRLRRVDQTLRHERKGQTHADRERCSHGANDAHRCLVDNTTIHKLHRVNRDRFEYTRYRRTRPNGKTDVTDVGEYDCLRPGKTRSLDGQESFELASIDTTSNTMGGHDNTAPILDIGGDHRNIAGEFVKAPSPQLFVYELAEAGVRKQSSPRGCSKPDGIRHLDHVREPLKVNRQCSNPLDRDTAGYHHRYHRPHGCTGNYTGTEDGISGELFEDTDMRYSAGSTPTESNTYRSGADSASSLSACYGTDRTLQLRTRYARVAALSRRSRTQIFST